jgi:DNA ligase-4
MQSNQYRGQRRRGTDNAPDYNEPGIERPVHLAPHGPSPPINRLTALFEWCSKKKLELRRRYLATWFDVGIVVLTYPDERLTTVSKNWRKLVGHDLYPVMRLLLPQVRTQMS